MSTTYEQYVDSKRRIDNVATEVDEGPTTPGYIYASGAWIADVSDEAGTPQYMTIVTIEECWNADLTIVEKFLWDNWVKGECS